MTRLPKSRGIPQLEGKRIGQESALAWIYHPSERVTRPTSPVTGAWLYPLA